MFVKQMTSCVVYARSLQGVIGIKECNVPIGEKIKQVREIKNVSQEMLGMEIGCSRAGVYQLESGKQSCSSSVQWEIKRALGVEGLPFTEFERKSFRDKLYFCNKLIDEGNFIEAKDGLEKLSVIVFLPCDWELNALYNLFYIRLLLKLNDVEAATAILTDLNQLAPEFDNELNHFYYFNKGTVCSKSGNYKDALDCYLKSRDFMKGGFEENQWLFYNIAYCLSKLSYVFSTIVFIENGYPFQAAEQHTLTSFALEHILAKNYLVAGHVKKAKKLLANCLEKAKSKDDKMLISLILVDFGHLYRINQDWCTAVEYIEDALNYLQKGSVSYLEALYQKVRCHIGMGNFPVCKTLLQEGHELSQSNKIYAVLFEALDHLMTLNDDKSMSYIEDVAIPLLLEVSAKTTALDYCKILQKHYSKKGTLKKQLSIEKIVAGIYEDMLEGGVIE